jgi:hypothetical protein
VSTRSLVITFLAAALGCAGLTWAQTQPAANDYSDPRTWLCRPGLHGACDTDLTTTVIQEDGSLSREIWRPDPNAPIDCFYVYPTVSTDPTPNSDMVADPAEMNVIRQQFARFGSKCRLYAPIYRQITLAGLRLIMGGNASGLALNRGIQYDDVRDAWNYYAGHDNQGRGFVLIGHSQGSLILTELIRREIEGKPVEARMISTILAGTTITVASGKDTGGSFQHLPVCRSTSQTGCVVTYASFRSTAPPPANTLFGKATRPDTTAVCTNPAALEGGSRDLHAYLSTEGRTITGRTPPKPWLNSARAIDTSWVAVPGMLTARCTSNEFGNYLEVTVHSDRSGRRTDDIIGDVLSNGQPLPQWGLHLVDMNLAMGNLVDIVGQQTKAWVTTRQGGSAR